VSYAREMVSQPDSHRQPDTQDAPALCFELWGTGNNFEPSCAALNSFQPRRWPRLEQKTRVPGLSGRGIWRDRRRRAGCAGLGFHFVRSGSSAAA
jgi:hypothetical protein